MFTPVKDTVKEIDKIWTREEIAKKVGELKIPVDPQQSIIDLATRVARVEGQLGVPTRPPHAWITPIIAIAGTAFVAFQSWIGITLVQHGNTLATMRGSLVQLGITVSANDPSSPKSQAEAKVAIAEARKLPRPIPIQTVKDGGKPFIDVSSTSPGAWNVALEFASYRTVLNRDLASVRQAQEIATTAADPKLRTHYSAFLDPRYKATTKTTIGGHVPFVQAATMHELGKPDPDEGQREGAEVILVVGAGVTLDRTVMRHVVIKDSVVNYHGGPMDLESITFVNCTLAIDNNPQGRALADALLADAPMRFSTTQI